MTLSQRVDNRGQKDCEALEREHDKEGKAEELQGLIEHAQECGPKQRTPNASSSAKETNATNHRGANDVEQHVLAKRRQSGLDPARVDDRGERGTKSREGKRHDGDARHGNPRNTRRSRILSDGVYPA